MENLEKVLDVVKQCAELQKGFELNEKELIVNCLYKIIEQERAAHWNKLQPATLHGVNQSNSSLPSGPETGDE